MLQNMAKLNTHLYIYFVLLIISLYYNLYWLSTRIHTAITYFNNLYIYNIKYYHFI